MAERRAQNGDVVVPSGSFILWLAGAVFGLSAALVLGYHLLHANRTGAPGLDRAHAVEFAPAETSPEVLEAHSEALKAATGE